MFSSQRSSAARQQPAHWWPDQEAAAAAARAAGDHPETKPRPLPADASGAAGLLLSPQTLVTVQMTVDLFLRRTVYSL